MQPRTHGSFTLTCQQLESRENPATVIADTFEAAQFPFAPPGWEQWASNRQQYYAITRNTAVSGTQSLATYGTNDVTSRLWDADAVSADATVWANVRSDTPAPHVFFARGSNLDRPTASYQGISIGQGGQAAIVRIADGVQQTLASVTPLQPVMQNWLHVSMTMIGDQVFARLQRTDTGQFLSPSGQWLTNTTDLFALNVPAISGGFAGITRLPGNYGTAYIDNFAVDSYGVVNPPSGGIESPPRVPQPQVPSVPPPPATIPPTVPPAEGQSPARNYQHIRIAQLAYDTTPLGTFETDLASSSVDLIIPNVKFLDAFESAAPDTTKFVYSNVSNLYQDLLLDWLSFADRTGSNREAAFYHVPQATPTTGSSPSSQPVTWLWGVSRGVASGTGPLTDLTPHARGGRTVGVGFGGTGEAVNLGYTERFAELNLNLSRTRQSDWTGVWEYVATTDGNGLPVVWKPLPVRSDSTANFQNNGQIAFDPPADWVPATLGGTTSRLYYLRFRTLTGTIAQAPEAKSIFGRDYVNAKGSNSGTIPAFDSTADRDGDGYLNPQEYAQRRPGYDAKFIYETRLFYPYYGQMRYVTNPSSQAIKNWASDYHSRILAKLPNADGIFLDNASGRIPFAGTAVIEPTANFTADSAAVVAAVAQVSPNRLVVANTSGGRTEANSITQAAGAALEEFLLRPNDANWTQVGDVAQIIRQRLNSDRPSPSVIIDSHPGSIANMTDPRTQMGLLAYYYLLADPEQTYLMIWGGFSPSAAWSQKWIPAATTDVGLPITDMSVFAEGTDPQNAKLVYKVFARSYEDALVLYKPRSYKLGQGTGTTDNTTATTHQLGGNYRELKADGTLGDVIQQMTLRNGEGAVLIKA